ncbi:hypothetical protein BC833DRAFT_617492 [Globomyces pollinis-pini]|nr:hypothetical protein BC833DRAFT_617492 [Globomyces pollinis-pini]
MIGYLEHYSYTNLLNKRVYSITATCISANITSLFVFAVFFYSWYSVSIVLKNSNSFSKRLSPKIQQVNQRVFPIFIIAFSLISIIFQTSNYFINKDKPLWLSIFRNFYGDAVSLCVAILLMPLLCDLIKAILMVNQIRKKQVHDEHSLTDQDPTLLMVRMTIICFLAILYHLFDAIFDLISPTALFALTGNLYHAALLEVRNPATPLLLILSTNGFFASMLYITKYMPKRLSKMKSVPKSRKTIELHDN